MSPYGKATVDHFLTQVVMPSSILDTDRLQLLTARQLLDNPLEQSRGAGLEAECC